MVNIVKRFANELYDARLKCFGKNNADRWWEKRKDYYDQLRKKAEGKEYRNMSEFMKEQGMFNDKEQDTENH